MSTVRLFELEIGNSMRMPLGTLWGILIIIILMYLRHRRAHSPNHLLHACRMAWVPSTQGISNYFGIHEDTFGCTRETSARL